MIFPSFNLPDGTPDPDAVFLTSTLLSAIYHNDMACVNVAAGIFGAQVRAFDYHPGFLPPGYLVLTSEGQGLVIIAGTTNAAQWAAHLASMIWPTYDFFLPLQNGGAAFAVANFTQTTNIMTPVLEHALQSIGDGPVKIAGHSFGGAIAYCYGRRLANATNPPSKVEILTYGQPKVYDARDAVREPDYYARVIAGEGQAAESTEAERADPVPSTPTNMFSLFAAAKYVSFLRKWLGISWTHHGPAYKLTEEAVGLCGPLPAYLGGIPGWDVAQLNYGINFVSQHYQDTSYTKKALLYWQRSLIPGNNIPSISSLDIRPDLSPLVPFASQYIGQPFTPPQVIRPSVTPAILNEAFFPVGVNPVNDMNIAEWSAVTAVGQFSPISEGGSGMTIMKGSMLFKSNDQGFSESWYAQDPSTTYASMRLKMATVIPWRIALSNTLNDTPPVIVPNALEIQFLRISDMLKNRDVLTETFPGSQGWNGAQGNLDAELAARIIWRNAGSEQIAATYFHCVPWGGTANPASSQAWRKSGFTATWKSAIQIYCDRVRAQGLGFQTLNLSPTNALGAITALTYQTTQGKYVVTTANPVPQGKFRVRLSQFKSNSFLNGRWPAVSTGANTFLVDRSAPNITWDGFGTALPLSGYNNNVPFSNYIIVVPQTATPTLLCSRKLGRPFYLQAGRASRRGAA